MTFGISLWTKRPEPPPRPTTEAAVTDAVNLAVQAKMGLLRAAIVARVATLKAHVTASDSLMDKALLQARVDELEFVLGISGKEE